MGLFMFKKIAVHRTFSLPEIQCASTPWTVFSTLACNAKIILSLFINIFF